METVNTDKRKRNIFKTVNKYQRDIIFLIFIPLVLMFWILFISTVIDNPILFRTIFHVSLKEWYRWASFFSTGLIYGLGAVLVLSLIVSFYIAHYLLGAFNRIIQELDEVIDGRSTRMISGRPGDRLAGELLKRVNVLVDFYVKNKK